MKSFKLERIILLCTLAAFMLLANHEEARPAAARALTAKTSSASSLSAADTLTYTLYLPAITRSGYRPSAASVPIPQQLHPVRQARCVGMSAGQPASISAASAV